MGRRLQPDHVAAEAGMAEHYLNDCILGELLGARGLAGVDEQDARA
jgi:hypothetical protein